jgi:hypothetical protein
MRARFGLLPLASLLAVASQLFMGGTAFAHHPEIFAEAVCDPTTGIMSIDYVSTSWLLSDGGGANPQIDILFNNVKVAQGSYEAPAYSFSGSLPAPAGDTVVVTALAVANWDNGFVGGQSTSTTVTVPPGPCVSTGLGRFTGGGFQVRVDGVRVSRGLTIHCDLLLSNNLEVNWGKKQFHMTEHLSTVACTDDPAIDQTPPAAPLDTLIGVGTGRYNNEDGYTILFTLVDAGEPGANNAPGNNDQAALYIFETANPSHVVLNIPLQDIDGGNLQAHYDQPHK